MGGEPSSHTEKTLTCNIQPRPNRPCWAPSCAALAQADAAAVTALVPFCVAKAEQPSEQATLARVRGEDFAFSRSELVMQAGRATAGTSKTPNNSLAITCANSLRTAKPAA